MDGNKKLKLKLNSAGENIVIDIIEVYAKSFAADLLSYFNISLSLIFVTMHPIMGWVFVEILDENIDMSNASILNGVLILTLDILIPLRCIAKKFNVFKFSSISIEPKLI